MEQPWGGGEDFLDIFICEDEETSMTASPGLLELVEDGQGDGDVAFERSDGVPVGNSLSHSQRTPVPVGHHDHPPQVSTSTMTTLASTQACLDGWVGGWDGVRGRGAARPLHLSHQSPTPVSGPAARLLTLVAHIWSYAAASGPSSGATPPPSSGAGSASAGCSAAAAPPPPPPPPAGPPAAA